MTVKLSDIAAASVSGYSGVAGRSGYSGKSGYSGAVGVGTSGFSGYSGTGGSGFSGYSGTGLSGFSGYSGAGQSGFSGYSGAGQSGFSGYSGSPSLDINTTPSISSNTLTLDLSTGSLFTVNLNSNINSLVLNNVSLTQVSSFILTFVADGTLRSVTWPVSFRWQNGVAPTITSTLNKKDVFVFFTDDLGVSWLAFVAGQNL